MVRLQDPVYGEIEFDGVLAAVSKSAPMLRLKGVRQAGAAYLAFPGLKTSRFEHSMGVAWLARRLGASEKEQIAGMLHDLSHTAFSHLIDYVIDNEAEDFHELHKDRFFKDGSLENALNSYNYTANEFFNLEHFPIIEKEPPCLCADRIDYALRDAIHFQWATQNEVSDFLSALVFTGNEIAIDSIESARWFQDLFNKVVSLFFKDPRNKQASLALSKLLKVALEESVIEIEDFFADDSWIEKKVKSDARLQKEWLALERELSNQTVRTESVNLKIKDRLIDPLVFQKGESKRLSEFSLPSN